MSSQPGPAESLTPPFDTGSGDKFTLGEFRQQMTPVEDDSEAMRWLRKPETFPGSISTMSVGWVYNSGRHAE